jgi:hypothetical protein
MRIVRGALAATTATLTALTLWAAPAHADVTSTPFYADSTSKLDTCPHGITRGTLSSISTGPARTTINVTGQLVDLPTKDSALTCTPDDYASTATFTAYSGAKPVASRSVSADNVVVPFQFSLGDNSTVLTSLTVQVCRNPVHTLPPSYCGTVVTYTG